MKHISRKNFNTLDTLAILIFTLLAIYSNQVTIFYILYLFWWNEVLYSIVTHYFKKRKNLEANLSSKFFLMGIYFIFIVLFFGFIAHYKKYELVAINFEILFFKNIFFNFNLVLFLLEIIWFYKSNPNEIEQANIHPFSARGIILHISIILGAFMMLLVVPNFPNLFTPDNNWNAVAIILPFIALRFLFQRKGLL
ncbi:hypothetical protein [Cellulophaga tyrosinoxydans]|uniref:Uncharacterized protein n=1 Tax=Cellulophaga tyrosinoxydans TaxID=504486 RepID=A0A1W2CE46_9FLAO|nr:hypothetical protein [Cellulophaga tyrosinoxydans]SMC83470.1 hypothetical protein SAMN05660703_2906 [Cellulophaga tyrosinoxydans]